MKRHFFIGSVGEPDKGYDEENFKRCLKIPAHVMHQHTKQKGVFDKVNSRDIIFLKYKRKLVAYGEVSSREISNDDNLDGWTYLIKVKKWYFYSDADPSLGVVKHGISDYITEGSQMATIKEIDPQWGIDKMKEISLNSGCRSQLYYQIVSEYNMEQYASLLLSNYNLILTGAPGTGKTYLAKQIAQRVISNKISLKPLDILKQAIADYETNEHESFLYEELLTDFTNHFPKEQLKEMTLDDYCIGRGENSKNSFCYWIERTLKPLGYYFPGSSKSYLLYWRKSKEDYEVTGYLKKESDNTPESLMRVLASDIHKLVNENKPQLFTDKFGESFILKILNSYYPHQYAPINSSTHINHVISLFDIPCESTDIFEKNKAIYHFYEKICDGKNISAFEFMHIVYENFNIKDGEIVHNGMLETIGEYILVQFHPSYDYTDFVEGIRPIQEGGNVGFERKDGVFKKLCTKALRNPNKRYVMIIDEINRGEISKIFGELFFSIDPGYRGKKGSVCTQYANMQTISNDFDLAVDDTDPSKYGHFFVPENVYIIGTMNDIDRSVESMDFAFRRRFAFKEITAEDSKQMLSDESAWGKDKDGNTLMPKAEVIEDIKRRMDNLNYVIWHASIEGEDGSEQSIKGLSSAFHIGASYFLKLVNYRQEDGSYDYNKLWENHLKGLLTEYLRGMPNAESDIIRLMNAYSNTNNSDNEQIEDNRQS